MAPQPAFLHVDEETSQRKPVPTSICAWLHTPKGCCIYSRDFWSPQGIHSKSLPLQVPRDM